MLDREIGNMKYEQEIVLREIFFEKLIENVEPYVIVCDQKGEVVFANTRCLSFFSSHGSGLMGEEWISKIVPGTKFREAERIFSHIKRNHEIVRFELPVMATPHLEKHCRCTAMPLGEDRKRLYMMFLKEAKKASAGALALRPTIGKAVAETQENIVQAFFDASMTVDPQTAVHSTRVMSYAVILARKLKVDPDRIARIRTASLMHDLGKIAIDKNILLKRSKLTKNEYEHIKQHPRWGADLMRMIWFLKDVTPIIEAHHENFGGGGYPKGMKDKEIPYESRILAVADIYEALTADRPYRKAYSQKEALNIMNKERSKKLDPAITDVFMNLVESGKFKKDGISR